MNGDTISYPMASKGLMRGARRSVGCVLACAAAIPFLAGPGTAWAGSNTIVTGKSIGPIKINMTRAKVHHVWDHKHSSIFHPAVGSFTERYPHGGLTVTYCCDKHLSAKVVSIATISAGWATDKGVGVSTSLDKLMATYPVVCHNDVEGPTGVLVACVLTEGNAVTTFHMDPVDQEVAGVQVF